MKIYIYSFYYSLVIKHFGRLFDLDKMGFQAPTRIQAQAIPVAMSGQHMYMLLFHNTITPLIQRLLFFIYILFFGLSIAG